MKPTFEQCIEYCKTAAYVADKNKDYETGEVFATLLEYLTNRDELDALEEENNCLREKLSDISSISSDI